MIVRSDQWTGLKDLRDFAKRDYDDTRAKLKVEGSRLQSLINGKSYGIGELELVPLQALRERVKSAGGLPGRLKVSVVTGDVRQMHQSPENAGALFQVASQFNLLEMVSPTVTPEHGVTRYQHDRTQGPACAIAAGAATIYRNYFAPVGGSHGQTTERQFDGLADLGETLGERLESAGQGLMENAKRLRAMHPCRARRHCGTSRRAATGAGRYPARQTVHRNTPRRGSHRCRRGDIGHWSRRPSARPSRWPTPVCRLPTGNRSRRWFCKRRTKPRCWPPC